MDKDYQNFVERMGSFEDELDLGDSEETYQSENPRRIIVTRNRSALAGVNEDELQHFGVIGMKWGHHRALNANTLGAAAKTGEKAADLGKTINKSTFNKKTVKEAKNLSDNDLKVLTNRLNLENNYINAKFQQSGRSKVENILALAGSTLAIASSAAVLYTTINKAK